MESTSQQTITCLCRVCGENYEWIRKAGRHVAAKMVCPKCAEWHHWCPGCSRGRLISEFDLMNGEGRVVQHRCKECLIEYRGYIKVRHCRGCDGNFVATNSTKFNGRTIWLCWDCAAASKYCKSCDTVKTLDAFNTAQDKATGRAAWCKECVSVKWAAKDQMSRSSQRLKKFDLTWDEYQAILDAQDHRCAICGLHETDVHRKSSGAKRMLCVDHCHTTGRVRQLLCGRCNKAIGLMQDDPERLRNAAKYLERHSV